MKDIDLRLYLVTDAPERYPSGLLAGVEAALAGGVTLVQYRPTSGTRRQIYEGGRALRGLLRARGVPLVVNDHVDLALALDADGVHVGQQDLPADVARRLIGPRRVLGLSITTPSELAGVSPKVVDHVGAGPVFPTGTKSDAAAALGLPALREIVGTSPVPVVAIGGIDLTNAAAVVATRVAGLAVVSALSRASDPAATARQLRSLFSPT